MMPDFTKEWFADRFKQVMSWTKGTPLRTILEGYTEADGESKVDALIKEAAQKTRENPTASAAHHAARRDWLVALKRSTRDAQAGRRFLWAAHGAGGRMFCAYNGHELIHEPEIT